MSDTTTWLYPEPMRGLALNSSLRAFYAAKPVDPLLSGSASNQRQLVVGFEMRPRLIPVAEAASQPWRRVGIFTKPVLV